MPEKYATASATQTYLQRFEHHADKKRVFCGLNVSALAVGTYLGAIDDATDRLYEEALVTAAQNGINFFDTAVNYRGQRSERGIAYALRKLAGLGISRDQIVVSTKGGFLPAEGTAEGLTAEGFRNYVYKCYLNTGIIAPEDIVANCHCMTPKYLASQINLSLSNLKVDAIDVYYLHNPETELREVGEFEFYARVTKAFELFESQVAAGKIKRYGVATWNAFRQGRGAADLVSLDKLIGCARTAAGDKHHFGAIQLPYNLAMLEAVAIQNQRVGDADLPIMAAAAHHGLSVAISAPLMQSQVAQIPPALYAKMPGDGTPMQKALQFVTSSPGVSSAMVGMKDVRHLEENKKVLSLANWRVEDLQNVARLLVKV